MFKVTFFISIFISEVLCHSHNGSVTIGYQKPNDTYEESAFLWGTFFFIICIIKTILLKFKIPVHYTIFATLTGVSAGLFMRYKQIGYKFKHFTQMDFNKYMFFYVPAVVYKVAFCLDIYTFSKSFPQILIISFPIALFTGGLLGVLIKLIVAPNWPWNFSIVFGIFCTPIGSSHTKRYLEELAVHMKHTSSLLDGEACIAVLSCFIAIALCMGHQIGFLTLWYHYVLTVLRLVLFGVLFGYIFGWIGRFLLQKMSTAHIGAVVLSFGLPFFTFSVTEVYFAGCGAISVLILANMMAKERSTLSSESDRLLAGFWKTVEIILNTVMCLTIGLYLTTGRMQLPWEEYVYAVFIYFSYYLLRFLLFLFFAPILTRLGYGMNLKTMLICVLGGLKSTACLIFAVIVATKLNLDLNNIDKFRIVFFAIFIYFLSYVINGSLIPLFLNILGVSQISLAKQVNINNCMKHVLAKRERKIAILKMDRYLSDADWPLVNTVTDMKHPDKCGSLEDQENDDFFIGYRYTFCPDCKKDVTEEPTRKELREMSKEAKVRILKAKKMAYSRQYENGMISKEGIRILCQAVELAMDSEDCLIQVDALHKRFHSEGWFRRFIRKRMHELSTRKTDTLRPPRTYWRRLCYHLLKKTAFDVFLYIVVIANTVIIIIDLLQHLQTLEEHEEHADDAYYLIAEIVCFLIYLFEFVVKILAFSRNGICKEGLPIYFKSVWNIMDSFVLIVFMIDIILEALDDIFPEFEGDNNTTVWYVHTIMNMFKLVRLVKLFHICRQCYPNIIKYLDSGVDANMAFTYELGKAYATGEEDVVKLIPQIIDHEKIQDELKQRMEQDRVMVTKLLGLVQKERPWIAITVKTKQAIRTIINSMKDAVLELKSTGWTDNYEHRKLLQSIQHLYKLVNSIKSVQPSAPDVIFKGVSWMADDGATFDFLFENVTVKNFEPGDVIFDEGVVADGIYIVVTGLFLLTYSPRESTLYSLKEYGLLPVVDYVSCMQYLENVSEYIVSGNCMGELSILTGRAFNCTITADAHSQVYVLSHGILKRAMELNPDVVGGLESRIWKAISIRLAVPILMTTPAYQSSSMDHIKYALERAFMPNLQYFKIFTITDMIQDIILIEGVARDFHSRDLFVAPFYIPRTVQKLILPASSLIDIPINIQTQLLIIPETGVDEFDVMLLAEETCEMTANASALKCLQHTVQRRSSRMRRRKRGDLEAPSRHSRRKTLTGASMRDMSSSSRYTAGTDASETDSMYFRNAGSEIQSEYLEIEENEVKYHSYSDDKRSP